MLKREYGSRNLGLNRATIEVERDPLEAVVSYDKQEPLHINYGVIRNAPSPGGTKRVATRTRSPNVPLRKLNVRGGRGINRRTRRRSSN